MIEQARVLHKRDSLPNWEADNPVLLRGEFAIVEISPTVTKVKSGDGSTAFVLLPYLGDQTGYAILPAVPATNPGSPQGNRIYETSTAGTYTHFLDNTAAAIVVNAGELAHLIDTGSNFYKIVLPLSTTGLATDAELATAIGEVFALHYPNVLQTGSVSIGNFKNSASGYTNAAPASADMYIDPLLSFDLSRLKAIHVKGTASGDFKAFVGTLDSSGNFVTLDLLTGSTTNGVTTVVNAAAGGYFDAASRAYIALQDDVGHPVRMRSGGSVDAQVWEYNATTGAFVAKLANKDVNYWVELWDELPLQARINTSNSVLPIKVGNPGEVLNPDTDAIVLIDCAGIGSGIYSLPRYGIATGKRVKIRGINMPGNTLDIDVADGGTIDGAAPAITLTDTDYIRNFVFDGTQWWTV